MTISTRIDRSMEHVQQALRNEGELLLPSDKKLIPLTDEQRAPVLDDLTIREAREANERLQQELKRIESVKSGIIEARRHLNRVVGGRND